MLDLRQVSKQYGNHKAVSNITLTVYPKDFIGFIGPNGAGKSTTIKMATGHLEPSSGSVFFMDKNISEDPLFARKNIGYVPEHPVLYEYLTGVEFMEFVRDIKEIPSSQYKNEFETIVSALDLKEEVNRLINTYSQGMRRKMALSAALLGSPALLILDESFNGLDPTSIHRLKVFLKQRTEEGTAVLLSSHGLDVLEKICNRIAIISSGTLLDDFNRTKIDEICRQYGSLEEYYMKKINKSDET